MKYLVKTAYRYKQDIKECKSLVNTLLTTEEIVQDEYDLNKILIKHLDVILNNEGEPIEPSMQDILRIGLYGNKPDKVLLVYDYYKKRYDMYLDIKSKLTNNFKDSVFITFTEKDNRYCTDDGNSEEFIYEYIIIQEYKGL